MKNIARSSITPVFPSSCFSLTVPITTPVFPSMSLHHGDRRKSQKERKVKRINRAYLSDIYTSISWQLKGPRLFNLFIITPTLLQAPRYFTKVFLPLRTLSSLPPPPFSFLFPSPHYGKISCPRAVLFLASSFPTLPPTLPSPFPPPSLLLPSP
jgi:hypothetical protein